MSTWLVDGTRNGSQHEWNDQLTKEVDMMKSHIPTMHVNITREGITINKVENNNLLESDVQLLGNDDDFEIRSQIGTNFLNFSTANEDDVIVFDEDKNKPSDGCV
jgi:hypothetical protein